MGLSGRRRPKREKQGQATYNPTADGEEKDSRHRQGPRTGNTYRRVNPTLARDMKGASLLAFEVNRGRHVRDGALMPPKPEAHPEIDAEPNANLHGREMVHVLDTNYHSHVTYSLNKQGRWKFSAQLTDSYQDSEELKAQNVFLIESVARGRKSGHVTRVATNALYTTCAAAELREHKRKLRLLLPPQPAESFQMDQKQLMKRDQFEFSQEVKQKQAERPLTSVRASGRGGGPINCKSVRSSCNLWNNLWNVSRRAEEARLEMLQDYVRRAELVVGTCVPCPGLDVNRCRQVDCQERRNDHSVKAAKDSENHRQKFNNRRMKQITRRDFELKLEMDGETEEVEVASVVDVDEADIAMRSQRSVVTLFDAMRPQDSDVSANRAKKLAAKARKMKRTMSLLQTESEWTVGSSGHDSGSESHDDGGWSQEGAAEAATEEVANSRLAAAVTAALAEDRQLVRFARGAAEAARLIDMFAADSGAAQALVIGRSLPRKLAIVLQPDLSEIVVFQEAETAEEGAEFASYAVYHACSDDQAARTSAREVASQADPFAFLRSLVAAGAQSIQVKQSVQAEERKISGLTGTGWRRADVLPETDARIRAIRALPMFSALAGSDVDRDVKLLPGAECEICCRPSSSESPEVSEQFAQGSTMLVQCGHSFCNQCWLQHVTASVASGQVAISCPGFQCKSVLDAATLLWFCPGEFLPALGAAAFRAWLADRSLGRQRRFCPRRNCGVLLEGAAGFNTVCRVCSGSLCLGCGQEPHWPADCATAARYRSKMEQRGHAKLIPSDLKAQVDVNAKQCPTCQLVMEKSYGCNHMTCPCGEHFCWWCGKPLHSHTSGLCFGDWNGTRSEFLIQRVFTVEDSVLMPSSTLSRVYCEAVKVRLSRASQRDGSDDARHQVAVADLFLSYAIRFRDGCRDNWGEARRFARDTAQRLVESAARASYLVEYAFAHMDSHRWDRQAKTAVRTIGSHVAQLASALTLEVDEQIRAGFLGPKRAKVGCERLLMMLSCLQSKCRLLHCIVLRHRDSPSNGLRTVNAV